MVKYAIWHTELTGLTSLIEVHYLKTDQIESGAGQSMFRLSWWKVPTIFICIQEGANDTKSSNLGWESLWWVKKGVCFSGSPQSRKWEKYPKRLQLFCETLLSQSEDLEIHCQEQPTSQADAEIKFLVKTNKQTTTTKTNQLKLQCLICVSRWLDYNCQAVWGFTEKQSFIYFEPYVWNLLPQDIRQCSTLPFFKT